MPEENGKVYVGNVNVAAKQARKLLLGKLRLGKLVDWGTAFSLWPVHLTTSCCGCEFAAAWSPRFDNEQHGALPWIGSRQTNMILIEGTVSKKMACAVRVVWEQMPQPKFAIAMGACALDGGLFYNSYNVVMVQDILPVDYYVPGCPPPPDAVARALIRLQEKVRSGKWRPRDVEDKKKLEEIMQPVYEEARRWTSLVERERLQA